MNNFDFIQIDKIPEISESLFYQLAELVPFPVSIHKNSEFMYMNKHGLELIGAESDTQIIGKSVRMIVHPDSLPELAAKMLEVEMADYHISVKNIKLIDLNGNLIITDLRAKSLAINDERFVLSIIQDVTEQYNRENELYSNQEKYRLLSELISDAASSVIVEPDGTLKREWSTDKLIKEYGYSYDDIDTFDKWATIVHPDDLTIFRTALESFKKSGKVSVDLRIITKQGAIKWINNTVHAYFDEKMGKHKLLSSVKDITEKKVAEEKLKKSEEMLRELNASKDKFFSIISHDLKNPFSSFLNLTEIVIKDFSRFTLSELNATLFSLNKSAKKLYKLLSNLLQWSQIQRGKMTFHPSEYVLSDIIRLILDYFDETAKEKSITIINNISDDILVFADVNMADSIFRNLIHNSIKFSDTNGIITIDAYAEDKFITVKISDNGVGISESVLNQLFKIDSKTSTHGTSGEEGSGLGLILCKEFITFHGGEMHIESEVGKGSCFYVTFPVPENGI